MIITSGERGYDDGSSALLCLPGISAAAMDLSSTANCQSSRARSDRFFRIHLSGDMSKAMKPIVHESTCMFGALARLQGSPPPRQE